MAKCLRSALFYRRILAGLASIHSLRGCSYAHVEEKQLTKGQVIPSKAARILAVSTVHHHINMHSTLSVTSSLPEIKDSTPLGRVTDSDGEG